MKMFKVLLVGILIQGVFGCSDIFEKNLEQQKVNIIGPADSLITSQRSFTFWWDYVEGATGYQLQIVEPSFLDVERLILDTIITENKFGYSLIPGRYQWRVSGVNSTSATLFTTYTLMVDTSAHYNALLRKFAFCPYNPDKLISAKALTTDFVPTVKYRIVQKNVLTIKP